MASVNKCIFIGNLTRDPELRYLTSGEAVANVSIACNDSYKDKSGAKVESVEFVNLVFYRRLAEIAGEYLKKGASIYVEGKMKTRSWEDKSGVKKYTTEIVVNEMTMLGGKQESSNSSLGTPSGVGGSIVGSKAEPAKVSASDPFDSDIPFAPHGKCGAGVSWRSM